MMEAGTPAAQAAPEAPDMPGASTEVATIRDTAAVLPVSHILTDDEIRRLWRIGSALAQSGMFKDARQAEQAFAKVLMGRDLGLSPTQAMSGIHIVEGKPEIAAVTMGSFVKAHERYDYRVVEHDERACAIEFYETDDGVRELIGTSRFTIEDAETANLAKKDNYKRHPRNMLFARAMSNGCKWYAPDVLGGLPVYTHGEIEQVPNLTDGAGDGEAQGLDLGPKVEAVLERAQALGHEGLADRAAAEMALGFSTPEQVDEWVQGATAVLDQLDPEVESDEGETGERGEGEAEEVTPDGADVEHPEEGGQQQLDEDGGES
jgi:hypothetical protein